MMMWYFLVSDALTFGGLLTAYGFVRASSTDAWPIGEQVFRALPGLDGEYPLIYVALMTFILIVSSVTMVLAVEAGHRNDKSGVIRWLGLTIIGASSSSVPKLGNGRTSSTAAAVRSCWQKT